MSEIQRNALTRKANQVGERGPSVRCWENRRKIESAPVMMESDSYAMGCCRKPGVGGCVAVGVVVHG
ncbi:hypothetical protein L484_023907 [Morus notabilis]|uniref:Uncharacterized protein n=1 Tax=Morus notabilis TaxID=981085 RepID=W9RFY3_9ROSA|nr:hypothetical protein L484_023907 [Morus notabilis]